MAIFIIMRTKACMFHLSCNLVIFYQWYNEVFTRITYISQTVLSLLQIQVWLLMPPHATPH